MSPLPQARDPRVENAAQRLFERILQSDHAPATIRSLIEDALGDEVPELSTIDRTSLANPLVSYILGSNLFAHTLKLELCQTFYQAFEGSARQEPAEA